MTPDISPALREAAEIEANTPITAGGRNAADAAAERLENVFARQPYHFDVATLTRDEVMAAQDLARHHAAREAAMRRLVAGVEEALALNGDCNRGRCKHVAGHRCHEALMNRLRAALADVIGRG